MMKTVVMIMSNPKETTGYKAAMDSTGDDQPRICRIKDPTVPEGHYRVTPSGGGKVDYSLFSGDPWPVRVANKLLGLYLWFRGRK